MISPDVPTCMRERIGLVAEYDGDSPEVARYRLPRVLRGNTLRLLSQRLLYVCGIKPEYATHYVSIADSGNAIAAGAAVLHEIYQPFAVTWYSSINLRKPENSIWTPDTDETPLRTILIDNSIRSGNTVRAALSLLATKDVVVDEVVSVVEYGTDQETALIQSLKEEYDTDFRFLFNVVEVDAIKETDSW